LKTWVLNNGENVLTSK